MGDPNTAAEIARLVADGLDKANIPYAIGGAIALGFYAPPRATIDVDVNVFVSLGSGLDELLKVLTQMGFETDEDPDRLRRRATEDGQFRGRVRDLRVDVFVPAVPFYATLQQHRREVPLLGRSLWIVGPEDLVVLKLMFFRRKDLAMSKRSCAIKARRWTRRTSGARSWTLLAKTTSEFESSPPSKGT